MKDLIRARRVLCGMSTTQLAELLGVSHDTVLRWEQGSRIPRDQNLDKLSLVLDLDYNELRAISLASRPRPTWGPLPTVTRRSNQPPTEETS